MVLLALHVVILVLYMALLSIFVEFLTLYVTLLILYIYQWYQEKLIMLYMQGRNYVWNNVIRGPVPPSF